MRIRFIPPLGQRKHELRIVCGRRRHRDHNAHAAGLAAWPQQPCGAGRQELGSPIKTHREGASRVAPTPGEPSEHLKQRIKVGHHVRLGSAQARETESSQLVLQRAQFVATKRHVVQQVLTLARSSSFKELSSSAKEVAKASNLRRRRRSACAKPTVGN